MRDGYEVSVDLSYRVSKEDMETLLEMAGYGISYWAASASVEATGYRVLDSDEAQKDLLEDEDFDWAFASFEKLAEALVKIGTGEFVSGYREYAADYLAEQDAGHIDADLADHVVQYAIYGEIVFG